MTDPRIEERRRRMGLPAVTGKTMVRGKPIITAATRHFKSKDDFVEALLANRADRSISGREQTAREAKLIARRRHQLGED